MNQTNENASFQPSDKEESERAKEADVLDTQINPQDSTSTEVTTALPQSPPSTGDVATPDNIQEDDKTGLLDLAILRQEKTTQEIIDNLQEIGQAVFDLKQQANTLTKQVEIMQKSMRTVDRSIADAATSLGAPRVRELYMRLLMMYDLVSPPPANLGTEALSICKMLAGQIEQFLEVNGFRRIPTDGSVFDPALHKPLKKVVVADVSMDGRIISTIQMGFQSEHAILRPASVEVGCFSTESPGQQDISSRGWQNGADLKNSEDRKQIS